MSADLSIVITNHDYAEFVGESIASALGQRGATVEVVVVDDGSTDGSRDVIAGFGDQVLPLFTPNGGQGAAFNAGFAVSTAPIVVFLDADDVLWADTARRIVELMSAEPAVARVQYPLDVIDRAGRRTGELMPARPDALFRGDPLPRALTCPDDIVWQPTSGNAFSRRALSAILPMPEAPYRLCADYYLSNLTSLHGAVRVLDGTGGGYRVHGANGHFADAEDVDRLRINVARTHETHRLLIDEARHLGLPGLPSSAGAVRSISAAANRILSYRLDAARHPIAGDSRRGLALLGIRSCATRLDLPPARKALYATWFAAMAVVPQPLVRALARPFVRLR